MRLDKIFSETGLLSRSQCSRAAKAGLITVDGAVVRDTSTHVDPDKNVIEYKGERVVYGKYVYIMMNKPEGYVCSNDEPGERVVFELLDERFSRLDLFTVGRLDKATVGLILITNDGASAHTALSPKHHVEKIYEFTLADPISKDDVSRLEEGAKLADGYVTMPCRIEMKSETEGVIHLREGKYHQIRRMFASAGNKVIYLKRTDFGAISLDPSLSAGEWRCLTQDEIKSFTCVRQSARNGKKTNGTA